jgi:heme/copper-type cytochrome/quinol oxidase subunit 2
MKNRIIVLCILLLGIILLVLGFLYTHKEDAIPQSTAPVHEITVHIPLHTWSFEPDHIELNKGELFRITVVNDDDIEHGFGMQTYTTNLDIPAHSTGVSTLMSAQTAGGFEFYCSVMCGEGMVAATGTTKQHERGHFDMSGMLTVTDPSSPKVSTSNK